MASKIQTYRSSVTRRRPADSSAPAAQQRETGELYLNMADLQLGFINANKDPQDLLVITKHSATADYKKNELVVFTDPTNSSPQLKGRIYRCKADISAKAFSINDWVEAGAGIAPYDPTGGIYAVGDQVIEGGKLYICNKIGRASCRERV